MNRRHSEAALRFAERRKREDEAPRLHTVVPNLESLKLEIEENRAGGAVGDAGHIRRVVVEYAPALFILPCGDTSCKDGGHDATRVILGALERGETRFDGEDSCTGQIGTATCGRVMRFVGIATYKA